MRKLDILDLLAHATDLDAATIAQRLGGLPEAARMLLLRLTRSGLIRREFDPDDGVFFYSITFKGKGRLSYLRQNADNPPK